VVTWPEPVSSGVGGSGLGARERLEDGEIILEQKGGEGSPSSAARGGTWSAEGELWCTLVRRRRPELELMTRCSGILRSSMGWWRVQTEDSTLGGHLEVHDRPRQLLEAAA
jgi:hypothetical protein